MADKPKDFKLTVLHELLHLTLYTLVEFAESKTICVGNAVDTAEHQLIQRLVKLVGGTK